MATLISIHTSDGLVSRCDSRCYSAKNPVCHCIACGGRNHGKGLQQALENTREIVEKGLGESLENYKALDSLDHSHSTRIRVGKRVKIAVQLSLPFKEVGYVAGEY